MSPQSPRETTRTRAPKRSAKAAQPHDRSGTPAAGRIAKLFVGQGHGFIRMPDFGEVYFHRSEAKDGTSFSDLKVGDAVTFELLDDTVSGARALRVRRAKPKVKAKSARR